MLNQMYFTLNFKVSAKNFVNVAAISPITMPLNGGYFISKVAFMPKNKNLTQGNDVGQAIKGLI